MSYCTSCGAEITEGVKFCGTCGKEQGANSANCSNCGKAFEENEKFCSGCGTPVNGAPKVEPKQKEPKFTKEGRKIIDAGPKPNQSKAKIIPSPTITVPPQRKKRSFLGCLGKTLLILLILIIAGVVIIWNLPDEEKTDQLTDTNIPGIVDIEPEVQSIQNPDKVNSTGKGSKKPMKQQSIVVDAQNPVATFGAIKVDFGQFNIDENTNVKIKEYAKQVIDGECSVTAYDIDVKGKSQFDDYICLSLPYNEAFIKSGTAEDCVAAQYFNEKTKKWEPVLYELDTENKLVNIFTDHLSRYGVFTVKDAKKRNAFITGVYITDRYLADNKKGNYVDVLENYYENNHSLGKEALNSGLSFWGKFSGESGVAINTLTAGGSYSTKFTSKLNDGFKNLGYAASVVQLGYDLCYSDNKTTAINLTKNIMNQLVAEFGTPAINVAFIGVYIIDVTLTEFGNAMLAQKYKELFDVYDYYNKTYNERSLKEWRTLMIDIHKDNPNDPGAAYKEIMEEIEDYAWKFMETTNIGKENENTAELNSLAAEAGLKRMAWPSEKDIEGVYGEGKQRIIDKLYPVFTSVNHWRFYNLKLELTKEASLLAKELNKRINLTITEDLEKSKKARYGGYIVAIRPLAKDVDKNFWTGKLKGTGETTTFFTFMGHYTAGMPNRIEVYKPDDTPDVDTPILVKEFEVKEGNIIVNIGNDEQVDDPYKKFDEKIFNYDYSKLYYEISEDDKLIVNYRNIESDELEGMTIRFFDKERKRPEFILYYMTGEYKKLFKQGKLGKGIDMILQKPGIGAYTMYYSPGEIENTGLISVNKDGYSETLKYFGKGRRTTQISVNGKLKEMSYFDLTKEGKFYCFKKYFYNNNGVLIKQEDYRENGSVCNRDLYNNDGSKISSEYFMDEN